MYKFLFRNKTQFISFVGILCLSSQIFAEGKNVKYKVNGFQIGGHPVNVEFDSFAMQGKLKLDNLNCWVRRFVSNSWGKLYYTYEIWGEDRGHWEFL